jgi:ABC-type protease/lipase transport system fused ATPase/permease subunit
MGGTLVIRGHLALGTVVAFVTVLKRLYGPASQLATAHVDLKTSYAYFDRIFAVMDRTPAIRNSEAAVIPTRIVGDVEFRHVSLAYDDAGEVLSRISLNVPAGATIGLVGPSGVFRRDTRRSSAIAAIGFQQANANGSRSRERSSRIRKFSFSMKRRARSTSAPSERCRRRSHRSCGAARAL